MVRLVQTSEAEEGLVLDCRCFWSIIAIIAPFTNGLFTIPLFYHLIACLEHDNSVFYFLLARFIYFLC